MKPRALVVRAPGTNCDEETAEAWNLAGATAEIRHIESLVSGDRSFSNYQVVTLPGGFSYGDDLGAGAILARKLGQFLADELAAFHDRGGLVIGICNGFQVLVRSGLLPGGSPPLKATLAHNQRRKFEARWVRLRTVPGLCPFVTDERVVELPVAHGEGRFLTREPGDYRRLAESNAVFLQYADARGEPTEAFPANPNGSPLGIAGVCNPTGRIFGLMPHPERYLNALHHPGWTRRPGGSPAAPADGLTMFRNAVEYLES